MSKHDGELVRQVLAGDEAAYEQLVSAYQGRIFAFVASRIRSFSATEDVVQNAFVEAYVHLKSLKSPDKFPGWLRGIALNLCNKWPQICCKHPLYGEILQSCGIRLMLVSMGRLLG